MKVKKLIKFIFLFCLMIIIAVAVFFTGALLDYFSPSLKSEVVKIVTIAKEQYNKYFSTGGAAGPGNVTKAVKARSKTATMLERNVRSGMTNAAAHTNSQTQRDTISLGKTTNNANPKDYGFIYVKTTPDSAQVTIDGKNVGKAPVTVRVSPSGVYGVQVTSKYYDAFEEEVKVSHSEVTKVHANLARGRGSLTVISIPQEAEVYLDGKDKGTTPLTLTEIEAGRHDLFVVKDKQEYEKNIEILAGENKVVNETLKVLKGKLHVNSEPPGAIVYIDGIKQGKTPVTIDDVKVGRHQIVLVRKDLGYVDSIVISSAKDNAYSATLKNKNAFSKVFSAKIKVESELESAYVYLNGAYYGTVPLELNELRIGEHEILLVKNVSDGTYFYEADLFLDSNRKKELMVSKKQFKFKKQ